MQRWVIWPCRIVALLWLAAAPAGAAQVWLAGGGASFNTDYMQLFEADAPWQQAAQHVQVFKISTQMALTLAPDQLSLIIHDLHHRHIALAMEALMVPNPPTCGNVEGFSNPGDIARAVRRLRSLGADLRYVAMDEPLWFAHAYSGPRACRLPIADLAGRIAGQVTAVRQSFPSAAIGDIEPMPGIDTAAWQRNIFDWIAAYRQATGENLAFFDMDIDWHLMPIPQVQAFEARLRASGVPVGIIYDGDPQDRSGTAWTEHAEQRFAAVESDPASVPDQAILHTWMNQPTHMLPENQPGTMTSLVLRYAAAETLLDVRRQGDSITGRLATIGGTPVPHVQVQVLAVDNGTAGVISVRRLSGDVPRGAAKATIGLRLDIECPCSGGADVTVGTMQYRDDRTGNAVQRRFRSPAARPAQSLLGGVGGEIHLVSDLAHPLLLGTPTFPVQPGDPFTLIVPLRATPDSLHGGYVAVIFLRADGSEVARSEMPLTPGSIPIGTATTGTTGAFRFLPAPNVLRLHPGYAVSFAGNPEFRMAETALPGTPP